MLLAPLLLALAAVGAGSPATKHLQEDISVIQSHLGLNDLKKVRSKGWYADKDLDDSTYLSKRYNGYTRIFVGVADHFPEVYHNQMSLKRSDLGAVDTFVTVAGSMNGLNYLPSINPKKVIVFDVNAHALRFGKLWVEMIKTSRDRRDFVSSFFGRDLPAFEKTEGPLTPKNQLSFLDSPSDDKLVAATHARLSPEAAETHRQFIMPLTQGKIVNKINDEVCSDAGYMGNCRTRCVLPVLAGSWGGAIQNPKSDLSVHLPSSVLSEVQRRDRKLERTDSTFLDLEAFQMKASVEVKSGLADQEKVTDTDTGKCRSLGYGTFFLKDDKAFEEMQKQVKAAKFEFKQGGLMPDSFANDVCKFAGTGEGKTVLYTMDMYTDGFGAAHVFDPNRISKQQMADARKRCGMQAWVQTISKSRNSLVQSIEQDGSMKSLSDWDSLPEIEALPFLDTKAFQGIKLVQDTAADPS